MSKIVNLHEGKNGEESFMLCPCTPEGTPFIVVAIVGESPIICSLVCPECETCIPVVNGIVR